MGLIAGYRHFWAPVLLATLLLSGLAHVAPFLLEAAPRQRFLEAVPPKPEQGRLRDWHGWERQVRWLLARTVTSASPLWHADAWIHRTLHSPLGGRVVYGRGGWLFFTGERVFQQSSGELKRPDQVEHFAMVAAALKHELARRGARLIVSVAPNTQTIYPEFLPAWAHTRSTITEYDMAMDALALQQVERIDLRPPLRAAKTSQQLYRRIDTHWNGLGALMAYNTIVEAVGWSDWRWNPGEALKGIQHITEGDLLAMLDINDGSAEEDQPAVAVGSGDIHPTRVQVLEDDPVQPSYVIETGQAGPTVAIIGDSFTNSFFRPFLLPHVGRLVWTKDRACEFDWNLVSRYDPALVILVPTERLMPCPPNHWPAHLPKG